MSFVVWPRKSFAMKDYMHDSRHCKSGPATWLLYIVADLVAHPLPFDDPNLCDRMKIPDHLWNEESKKTNLESVARSKCFLRLLNTTQLIVTFVPASYNDLLLLTTIRLAWLLYIVAVYTFKLPHECAVELAWKFAWLTRYKRSIEGNRWTF